jgi:predicted Zn-dependent protease
MSALETFEKMLAAGKDSAMLRYGLGNEYLKAGRPAEAAAQFEVATRHDPDYSAAWKLLGKALADANLPERALSAYRQGISVAEARGDIQAAKEMKVFAKRLEKQLAGGA